MNTILLIAVIAGLLGMVGWGCADFFAKKTIDEIGDIATLFWSLTLGLIPLAILMLAWHSQVPALHSSDSIALLVFGVVSGLSYLPLYRGFGLGKVSILSPVFASYGGAVVLISAFIFGEFIPAGRWLALAIIFLGIILMSVDLTDIKKSWKTKDHLKGFVEVLSAMVIFSFWLAFWGHYTDGKIWIYYVFIMRAIAALTILAVAGIQRMPLAIKKTSLWWPLLAIGTFDVIAYSGVTWGFSATSMTSIVALLSGAFSLPTLVLARLFLGERLTRTQTLAASIIIIGIAIIALSSK